MPIKIATWNVNSIRVRLPHVLEWIRTHQPDVLGLQETKIPDESFPLTCLQEVGYQVVASGQKTYNGVAFLSRNPLENVVMDFPSLADPQRRVLAVTYQDIRILNLYVPNGETVTSEKFEYKLTWLRALKQFLTDELKKYSKMIILGDFNIAPAELDVHNPKRWEGKVLYSEQERRAFEDILNLGFHDCFRKLFPEKKAYSWWDYRLNAFERGWGMRIDHILATPTLSETCIECLIDESTRVLDRPSDHAPVMACFR